MAGVIKLKLRMYIAISIVFAIGFGVFYALMIFLRAGIIPIMILAVLFFLLQWYISPKMIKWASHLKYADEKEYPELSTIINKLSKQANVPKPRLAISDSTEPNAFVFGRTKKNSTLVVHKGLLDTLNANEITAVLAHEIGHLHHNDVVIMTFISFIPMLTYLIAQNLLFAGMFGGFDQRNGGLYFVIIGIGAFVAYIFSQLMVLSLSRARESYADIYSAQSTKKPEHLASALIKIMDKSIGIKPKSQNKSSDTIRSLYIMDVFSIKKDISDLKLHIEDVKKMLPDIDINHLIKKAEADKTKIHMMASMFATHPSLYRRIITLSDIKNEDNPSNITGK